MSNGARLPLTPDWSGVARSGVPARHAALLDAKPFARFDYSYVGASRQLAGGHRIGGVGQSGRSQDAYEIGNLRFGLEADHWTGSIFVDNLWDERADLFLSNRWKVQRQVGQPAANHRDPVPLQLLKLP